MVSFGRTGFMLGEIALEIRIEGLRTGAIDGSENNS